MDAEGAGLFFSDRRLFRGTGSGGSSRPLTTLALPFPEKEAKSRAALPRVKTPFKPRFRDGAARWLTYIGNAPEDHMSSLPAQPDPSRNRAGVLTSAAMPPRLPRLGCAKGGKVYLSCRLLERQPYWLPLEGKLSPKVTDEVPKQLILPATGCMNPHHRKTHTSEPEALYCLRRS